LSVAILLTLVAVAGIVEVLRRLRGQRLLRRTLARVVQDLEVPPPPATADPPAEAGTDDPASEGERGPPPPEGT
jgi:hypothetical protein